MWLGRHKDHIAMKWFGKFWIHLQFLGLGLGRQARVVIKNIGSEIWWRNIPIHVCPLWAVWCSASYSASLNLSFFICNMSLVIDFSHSTRPVFHKWELGTRCLRKMNPVWGCGPEWHTRWSLLDAHVSWEPGPQTVCSLSVGTVTPYCASVPSTASGTCWVPAKFWVE